MSAAATGGLQAGLGAMSALGGKRAGGQGRQLMGYVTDYLDRAKGYDPIKDAQGGIDYAKQVYDYQFPRTMNDYYGKFWNASGNPGLSSEGALQALQAMQGPTDVFKRTLAQLTATPERQRLELMLSALQGTNPGGLAQSYFQQANQGFGAGAGLLGQGLGGIFKQPTDKINFGQLGSNMSQFGRF